MFTIETKITSTNKHNIQHAIVYKDGIEVARGKSTFINRTWERYDFQKAVDEALARIGYYAGHCNSISQVEDFLNNKEEQK